jgi:hypothetical protein
MQDNNNRAKMQTAETAPRKLKTAVADEDITGTPSPAAGNAGGSGMTGGAGATGTGAGTGTGVPLPPDRAAHKN